MKAELDQKVSNDMFIALRNRIIESYVTYERFAPVQDSITSLATNIELGKLRDRIDKFDTDFNEISLITMKSKTLLDKCDADLQKNGRVINKTKSDTEAMQAKVKIAIHDINDRFKQFNIHYDADKRL